jgi:predicted O-linked N-acetylglucosamine transferase (SPINDLY family)
LAAATAGAGAGQQHWQRGVALARQGQLGAALLAFEKATRRAPRVAMYWLNLASTQRKLGQVLDALSSGQRAFALEPQNEVACHFLAELLRLQSRDEEALRVLQGLAPEVVRSARHWLLEGAVLMNLQRWPEAASAFLNLLALKPADTDAYQQLGFSLAYMKRYGDAAECFRTINILDPGDLSAAVYAAHNAAWACDWANVLDDQRRLQHAVAQLQPGSMVGAFSPFCVLSMDDDPVWHRQAAALEARRVQAGMAALGAGPRHTAWPVAERALSEGGRIRVGFVSGDFREHATSMLLVQTLEALPRERFEVLLYSHGQADETALRQRMVAAADHFIECGQTTPVAQVQRIHDDGIHVLVDLSGYTANTRIGVFAQKPAPVQVLWLAYPSTIGGDFMDYVVGDPVLTPLNHAHHFAEHIAQLPVCYEPTDELRAHPEPLDRAACGLPEDAFVFACFNQSYKITEPVFNRWCRILARVPGSVLWLLVPQPEIQAALLERAAERGLDPARVLFAPFVDPLDHLARLPQADLFLDTFPYGAHTTCSDALWMGLPVLTQQGQSFSARVAASLLHAVELPELVVHDEQAYEDRAVALATERTELACMREHLWNNRRDLPLFDNQRFTGELAALFERMVGRWQQGLPPEALPAAL